MPKKTFSVSLELTALRTVTSGNAHGQRLLGLLTDEHFSAQTGIEAHQRVRSILGRRGIVLPWASLIEDPVLSDGARAELKAFQGRPVAGEIHTKTLFDQLDTYRRHRSLIELHNALGQTLSDNDLDVEQTLQDFTDRWSRIRSTSGGVKVTTLGVGDNAANDVRAMLKGTVQRYLPTGFRTFDSVNVGIPIGSLMVIGAPSGGMKSSMCKTLLRNFALQGARAAMIPLEMNNLAVLQRNLSEQSQIEMNKFLDPAKRMSRADKQQVWDIGYRQLSHRIKQAGGSMNLLQFEESTTVENALLYCKSMGYNVGIVDYIGLLEGADGDDQVRALSRIARYAKLWAEQNAGIAILAAQLSAEGLIRYSRAITEHASTQWQWSYTPANDETNSIRVIQPKSRQQEAFGFDLFCSGATMEIRDHTDEELKALRGQVTRVEHGTTGTQRRGAASNGGRPQRPTNRSDRYLDDLQDLAS